MTSKRRYVLSALLLCGLAVVFAPSAVAQAPPAKEDNEQDKEKESDKILREQTIYIPYEKLRKVFEKQGRGVFLPYEKFQELWKAAREKEKPPTGDQPPVGALLSEVENEATVAKDVVRVKAKVKIEVLAKGWNEIPLRLADAAITRAEIAGAPARIVPDGDRGYKLLFEKKGTEPESIELDLEFAKAITSTPGQNQVSFEAPQAPVSRWRVVIPESGVKVNIHPMIAASEVPVEKADAAKSDDNGAAKAGETVVLAFVGAAPTVRIDWTPKAEGATGLEALASVEGDEQVWVNEGVTRTQTRLAYTISRAKLATLAIEVPADQKVVNVFDANVRQWSVEKSGDAQKITVQLFEPAEGSQQVTVELEKFADQADQKGVSVPVVKALGVGRQQGVVVVQVAQGLKAEASKRGGLLQVDAADLPPSLARAKWDFSYRYATVPFELTLAVEKVEPRVLVDSLVEAELQPQRLAVRLSALYTIERAGVFRLELDVPEGYEVRRVTGCKIADAAEAQVDTHHLTGEKKTRLVVNLARKALGRVGLAVDLERQLHEPDLLTPAGKAAKIPLTIPRIAPGTVQHDVGRLVVYGPPSLRVNPEGEKSLRAISLKEALEGMTARGGKGSDLQPILEYAFTQEPTALTLAAERRKPQVTIGQLLVARIEDDAVKYEATFFYDILYSGVKSLRIDVPTAIAPRLRNKTPGVRDKVIEPAPKDVAPGCQAWSFSGETELKGKGRIHLVWEDKIEKLGIGQSVPLVVPRLVPAKADQAKIDRSWGQIVVVKAETIDIHPSGEPKGLRPIDPQHDLMPDAAVPGAAGAFEFHDDWVLTLTATRYELEDVKRTSIERAVVRMVVTRADQVSVQALYRVRSAQQRLEVELPEDVRFDAEPLRINGRPVTLEGKEGKYFVPLVGSSPDVPFVMELRYTVPGDGGELVLPEFPEDPAVLKVYLCAYLPDELALLAKSGPWTDEIRWRADGTWNWWRPDADRSDAELIAWVRENLPVTDTSDTFETDGRRYVFSTLRPVGPLGLTKINEKLLTGVLLAVIVLGGLLLLPARAPLRALAVGVLVIVLILSGVFQPIFARQVFDGYLLAALAVVAVLWAVAYFARRKPPRPVTPAPAETPPAPAAPETTEGGTSNG